MSQTPEIEFYTLPCGCRVIINPPDGDDAYVSLHDHAHRAHPTTASPISEETE